MATNSGVANPAWHPGLDGHPLPVDCLLHARLHEVPC